MGRTKAYTKFAALYDWVMDGVRYEMWADYVSQITQKYGVIGKDLLDLACGTGNTSFTMARRGYKVVGVDYSQDMVDVAKFKASYYSGPASAVNFRCQDMRQLNLGSQFDVITCLFDSLNYVTEYQDLAKVFSGVIKHMKPNALFVFDVNTEYQLAKTGKQSPTLFERGEDVALFWRDEWCSKTKMWRVHLDGFIKNGDTYERFTEVHEERAYSIEQIEESLLLAGFSRIMVYDAYSFAPPRADSGRLYFVART